MGSIGLRSVREDDLGEFFVHQLDSVANRMAAFVSTDPGDRGAFDARWSRIRADPSITVRTIIADDEIVGHVLVYFAEDGPEVSYWIGRRFWGRGHASAALTELLGQVTLRPLRARVASDNVAAITVLERCGFVVTGRAVSYAEGRAQETDELYLELID